jgi:PAS domain S-box-containing protein
MTFSTGFQLYPWVERALAVRHNPIAAYSFAVAMIALAVLVRWIVGEYVGARIPFITFFPAIILATLVGGLWPGIFATVLSTLAAWFLFVPPYFSMTLGEREVVQLLLFIVIASINVAIVGLLDALVERLVLQQRNIRVILEAAPSGFVLVDEHGTIKLVNSSTEKLFGYSREELTGKYVEVLVPEQHIGTHRHVRASYQEKPETRAMGLGRDLSGRRKDGTEFPIEIGLNTVGRDGKPSVLATVIDISARKQVQEDQQLIIRELEHRTQNLFAVFQAIVSRSFDDAKTPAQAKFILSGRVQALAQAYSALAKAAWQGASLAAILDQQFSSFSNRLNVSGCDIVISPSAAHQFALITHELATNAFKYGALSTADGRVSIEGKIDRLNGGGTFSFVWRETGRPPVTQPSRKGFGSIILLDSAKRFAQSVALDYATQGLTYELQFELSAIQAAKTFASPETGAALSKAPANSV